MDNIGGNVPVEPSALNRFIKKYNAKHDPDSNGLLLHAVYSRRHGDGVDECNIWGCYYYMEALVRMLKGTKAYW